MSHVLSRCKDTVVLLRITMGHELQQHQMQRYACGENLQPPCGILNEWSCSWINKEWGESPSLPLTLHAMKWSITACKALLGQVSKSFSDQRSQIVCSTVQTVCTGMQGLWPPWAWHLQFLTGCKVQIRTLFGFLWHRDVKSDKNYISSITRYVCLLQFPFEFVMIKQFSAEIWMISFMESVQMCTG